jgi:uncharacterized protein YigE (DUF2233 family)
MKKIIFFLVLFLALFGVLIYFLIVSGFAVEKEKPVTKVEKPIINIPEVSTNSGDVDNQNTKSTKSPTRKGYRSIWITVNDVGKLFLNSNLSKKLDSKTLATRDNCEHLVSGGFYDTNDNHLGLFISEGETINEERESSTFNGFFNVSKSGLASITRYPIFSPRISLQTGPFLLENGKPLELSINNDKNARRVAVGITNNNLVVFIVIYEQSNTYSGPKLSELPEIIENINKEKKLGLVNVINLDGGAHSAFISDLVSLNEASPIGSYFCIKP